MVNWNNPSYARPRPPPSSSCPRVRPRRPRLSPRAQRVELAPLPATVFGRDGPAWAATAGVSLLRICERTRCVDGSAIRVSNYMAVVATRTLACAVRPILRPAALTRCRDRSASLLAIRVFNYMAGVDLLRSLACAVRPFLRPAALTRCVDGSASFLATRASTCHTEAMQGRLSRLACYTSACGGTGREEGVR